MKNIIESLENVLEKVLLQADNLEAVELYRYKKVNDDLPKLKALFADVDYDKIQAIVLEILETIEGKRKNVSSLKIDPDTLQKFKVIYYIEVLLAISSVFSNFTSDSHEYLSFLVNEEDEEFSNDLWKLSTYTRKFFNKHGASLYKYKTAIIARTISTLTGTIMKG